MYYIDALKLVDLAIEHQVLQVNQDGGETDGYVFIATTDDTWELWEKELVVRDVMGDPAAQSLLTGALAERGVKFTPYEGSELDRRMDALLKKTASPAT